MQSRGIFEKPVKHKSEMTLHFLTAPNEGVTMSLCTALNSAHDTVHVLPENTGAAGELRETFKVLV